MSVEAHAEILKNDFSNYKMNLANYKILQDDISYLITKKDISITIIIQEPDVASVIGTTTLEQLKKQTEKWRIMKYEQKENLSQTSLMFVKFIHYSCRWIMSISKTETDFLNNKVHWYSNRKFKILASILGMIMTKYKTIEVMCQ